MYTLTQLNHMDQATFTKALGAVFEDTPAIASQAWEQLPFERISQLHETMVNIVNSMDIEAKTTLICAHPSLGDRVKMAEASVLEQSSVGLDRLSFDEYHLFQSLNQSYRDRFGFPFIIAVRNHTKNSIIDSFKIRLQNSPAMELDQAIAEISEIARFRLQDLILLQN